MEDVETGEKVGLAARGRGRENRVVGAETVVIVVVDVDVI
jgi:hypothetical protein